MFKIRKAQMEVFSGAARQRFEDEMAARLGELFPTACQALGEVKTREMIQYGTRRAAAYGIEIEADVAKYLILVFGFGRDFDRDPKLPWAQQVLRDPELTDPSTRIDCLYDEALQQAREEAGVEDEE